MRPCRHKETWKETQIINQTIDKKLMANKKFDYSNELAHDAPQSENEECKADAQIRRLEERSTALANEFRDLKSEIGWVYNCLRNLVEKSGALSGTMLGLLELLKTVLPVRLTDADKKTLQNELHAIADNAVSKIRKERERTENDIRRNSNRIFLTPATFWCMVALLILLSTFFAIVVFANMKLLHSGILTEITIIYSVLIVLTLIAIAFAFYYRH